MAVSPLGQRGRRHVGLIMLGMGLTFFFDLISADRKSQMRRGRVVLNQVMPWRGYF